MSAKSIEVTILEKLFEELRTHAKRDKLSVQFIYDFWRITDSVNTQVYELNTHIDIECRKRYEEDQIATQQYEMIKQYIAVIGRCLTTTRQNMRDVMDDRRRMMRDGNEDDIIMLNLEKTTVSLYNEFVMVAKNNVKTMLALANDQKYKDHLFNRTDMRGSSMHD